ncbi:uncharacterized protein LOC107000344 [Macaca mulatta]
MNQGEVAEQGSSSSEWYWPWLVFQDRVLVKGDGEGSCQEAAHAPGPEFIGAGRVAGLAPNQQHEAGASTSPSPSEPIGCAFTSAFKFTTGLFCGQLWPGNIQQKEFWETQFQLRYCCCSTSSQTQPSPGLAKTSSTVFNGTGERRRACCVPDMKRKAVLFHADNMSLPWWERACEGSAGMHQGGSYSSWDGIKSLNFDHALHYSCDGPTKDRGPSFEKHWPWGEEGPHKEVAIMLRPEEASRQAIHA